MASLRSTSRLMATLALTVVLGSLMSQAKPSIPMDYCASINTGGAANYSIYQSDGLCHDFCNDDNYALAIVQGKFCWCSNYVPDKAKQVDTTKCSNPCPGYTVDVCGGDDTFGYMTLVNSPSGTSGGSTSSPQKTTAPQTKTSSSSASTSSSSSSSSSSTSSDDQTTTPTPSIRTVTQGGSVSTVTLLPSTPADSAGAGAGTQQTESKKGLSTGAAVGIAVGLVGAAAAGIIIFVICRRRRRHDEDDGPMDGHSPRGSSAGMMQASKVPEVGVTPPYLGKMEGPWESDQSGRRRSMLMPIDPRIDPGHSGIYNRAENKSHDSINTLRDDQDYSRRVHQPTKVLRATNPDPDDD